MSTYVARHRGVPRALLIIALLGFMFPAALRAQTDTTLRCFYDDAGRLIKALDSNGNEIDYTYDAVGNLLQISRSAAPAASALAIFNFTPQRGTVGSTVTIQGQNFAATPGSNTVTFNGTAATVVSATTTTLVVTVPMGASTGPISLTVAGTTVQTSAFTVIGSILIAPLNPAIPLGKTVQFTATQTLSNGTSTDVTATATWSSSNSTVATVSNASGSSGLATSVAVGETLVTATLGAFSASTDLTVNPAAIVSLAISPINPTFAAGENVQFTATATLTDGVLQDETNSVTWSSSDTSVATVGVSGLVSTLAQGTSTIAAALGSFNASTLLTVSPPGSGTAPPRFAYSTDLSGSASGAAISVFTVDSGQLRPAGVMPAPSANLSTTATVITPSGQFAYLLSTNGLYGFSIDPNLGTWTAISGSPFATSTTTNTAAVTIDPTGQFVLVASTHAANNNSVLAYTIGASGALTASTAGSSPAGALPGAIAIDPTSTFVYTANEDGNSISAFVLNHSTGALTAVAGSPFTGCSDPVSLTTDTSGKFLYVAGLEGGICAYSINTSSGALTEITGSPFSAGVSPVCVVAEPLGNFLYVVNQNSNSVSAFSVNPSTGALAQIAQSPFSVGTTPVFMSIDPSGNFAYVTNQGSSNISEFVINTSTGVLTPVRSTRSGGDPAYIAVSRGTAPLKFVPVGAYFTNQADNTVSANSINPTTGALTTITNSPFATGKGPIAVTADLPGKYLFVANTTDGTLSGYNINSTTGALAPMTGSPFTVATSPAYVAVDPSDRYVYVANEGSNNVSGFALSGSEDTLTAIATSPFATQLAPSGIGVDPRGKFVYVPNQTSDTVSLLDISSLGILSVGGSAVRAGSSPVAALVEPTGNFVYVANSGSNNISAYSINASSGALSVLSGSPFTAGTKPVALATDPLGRFLFVADAGSNDVFAYSIDPFTGVLTALAGSPFAVGTTPLSLSVDYSGSFLYVVNSGSNTVSIFSVNQATGALTATSSSPFSSGNSPSAIFTTGVNQ